MFLISVSLIACKPPHKNSITVPTERIYVRASVEAESANNAYIEVNLYEDRFLGDVLELTDGDRLTATYQGKTITLREETDILEIDYEGNFNSMGVGGEYYITLHRNDGTMVESSVYLPAPFTILSPSVGEQFLEGDDIAVEWASDILGGVINVRGHLACYTKELDDDSEVEIDNENENESWIAEDLGVYRLPMEELIQNLKQEVFLEFETIITSAPCDFDFDMYRENKSDLSVEFAKGSHFTARQVREVDGMKIQLQ